MWKLVGYDTFEGAYYSIPSGDSDTEAQVLIKAAERLLHLKRSQPDRSSGGQSALGIQDRIFIKSPEGKMRRYMG